MPPCDESAPTRKESGDPAQALAPAEMVSFLSVTSRHTLSMESDPGEDEIITWQFNPWHPTPNESNFKVRFDASGSLVNVLATDPFKDYLEAHRDQLGDFDPGAVALVDPPAIITMAPVGADGRQEIPIEDNAVRD